jgi:hypothetical protein
MTMQAIWVTKLFLSHLVTDFILQPSSWVEDRNKHHFSSGKLYLHGAITGLMALIFIGSKYWFVTLIITITHILIDGWKSYRTEKIAFFLLDQLFHMLVILGCWCMIFFDPNFIRSLISQYTDNGHFWIIITAIVFLTSPAGILIGKLTKQWRDKIEDAESLANAGKWIGMTERLIVLLLVLQNQYSAIGLLVTAKGIIRFNEKDRPEAKTEYLVIGTLLSIALAMGAGLLVKV